MRSALTTDPDVLSIALTTNLDEFAVVGRLLAFWAWADEHLDHSHARGVTFAFVDRLVRCDGFAKAMASVDWLEATETGLNIPGYEDHLSKSAKRRGKAAKRQAGKRDRDAGDRDDSHAPTVTKKRPEKEKEKEKDITPHKPPKGGKFLQIGFDNFWKQYPRKAAKGSAAKAYNKAINLINSRFDDIVEAVEFLGDRVADFAESDLAGSKFCPHPATWLSKQRFDDNPAEWELDDAEPTQVDDEAELAFEAVAKIYRCESSRIQFEKGGADTARDLVRTQAGPIAASSLSSVGSWAFFRTMVSHNRGGKLTAFKSAYKAEAKKIRTKRIEGKP